MQNTEIKGNRDCRKTDYLQDGQGIATLLTYLLHGAESFLRS